MDEKLIIKDGYFVKRTLCFLLLLSFSAQAKFQISTFNIRNYDKKSEHTDKKELSSILNDLNSDLIATEEIYNNESFIKFIDKEMPDYNLVLSRCGGGGSQNIGFVYKKSTLALEELVEDAKIADLGGVTSYGCSSLRPALLGFFRELKTNKKFVAIALHLKAGGGSRNFEKRNRQYKYILKMIRELRLAGHKNIIVLGDLNTTGWGKNDQDEKNFLNLLKKSGTSSTSKNLQCTSYWAGKNQSDDLEEPSVLDHIVHTPNFMGLSMERTYVGAHCKVANCELVYNSVLGSTYSNVSDHCPVTAVFK
jgi:endonuclease/exonuclease/phosphatase family metal-dependent hydrolase